MILFYYPDWNERDLLASFEEVSGHVVRRSCDKELWSLAELREVAV